MAGEETKKAAPGKTPRRLMIDVDSFTVFETNSKFAIESSYCSLATLLSGFLLRCALLGSFLLRSALLSSLLLGCLLFSGLLFGRSLLRYSLLCGLLFGRSLRNFLLSFLLGHVLPPQERKRWRVLVTFKASALEVTGHGSPTVICG